MEVKYVIPREVRGPQKLGVPVNIANSAKDWNSYSKQQMWIKEQGQPLRIHGESWKLLDEVS